MDANYLEELLWEHREKGCGAKQSASSNKKCFSKNSFPYFKKRGLIAEVVALGTPYIKL
ncbi:hypothetical protein [Enterococcus thailandicus]|uniref:hypothetical protein n=1 Tax=Enterococcus thailandicus TaxID=417368 RepID=UPI000A9F6098|nr:hypothetical protein [Enterococcus thailandicus]